METWLLRGLEPILVAGTTIQSESAVVRLVNQGDTDRPGSMECPFPSLSVASSLSFERTTTFAARCEVQRKDDDPNEQAPDDPSRRQVSVRVFAIRPDGLQVVTPYPDGARDHDQQSDSKDHRLHSQQGSPFLRKTSDRRMLIQARAGLQWP